MGAYRLAMELFPDIAGLIRATRRSKSLLPGAAARL
jgi:hypothetical protein